MRTNWIACLALWYAMRWLFMKRYGADEKWEQWNLLWWWIRIKSFLLACYEWLMRTGSSCSALDFYAALRRWGQFSGFRQRPAETPKEYGRRLSQHFPQLKPEIMLIIEMLHREVYGEQSLSSKQISKTRKAWKKLHSPLMWPFRLKSIMTNS